VEILKGVGQRGSMGRGWGKLMRRHALGTGIRHRISIKGKTVGQANIRGEKGRFLGCWGHRGGGRALCGGRG